MLDVALTRDDVTCDSEGERESECERALLLPHPQFSLVRSLVLSLVLFQALSPSRERWSVCVFVGESL